MCCNSSTCWIASFFSFEGLSDLRTALFFRLLLHIYFAYASIDIMFWRENDGLNWKIIKSFQGSVQLQSCQSRRFHWRPFQKPNERNTYCKLPSITQEWVVSLPTVDAATHIIDRISFTGIANKFNSLMHHDAILSGELHSWSISSFQHKSQNVMASGN